MYKSLWSFIDYILDSFLGYFSHSPAVPNSALNALSGLLVGHRGVRLPQVPENTIEAITLASTRGLKAIEFDVRQTSDGELVIFHNTNTGDEMNQDVQISSTPWNILKLFTFNRHPDVHIPQFADVLKLCKDLQMFACIEIKSVNSSGLKKIVHSINMLEMKDSVLLLSFNPFILRSVAYESPYIPLQLNIIPRTKIPIITAGFHLFLALHLCKFVGASVIGLEVKDATNIELSQSKLKHLQVMVWSIAEHDDVNNPDIAREFLNRGCAVCTDRLENKPILKS